MLSLPHDILLTKSLDHLAGSGLYAVTKTAGELVPLGIPRIMTWCRTPGASSRAVLGIILV